MTSRKRLFFRSVIIVLSRFRSPRKLPNLIGSRKNLVAISRTPMPDLNNQDREDEYSHRIYEDAHDYEPEDDTMGDLTDSHN